MGSPQSHRRSGNRLAKDTNSIVIVPNYRLAPENPFPAAIEDCLSVFDFVTENHKVLGISPDKIAVAGGSAGGNLAAIVANHRRHAPVPPRFQVLWYPDTKMSTSGKSFEVFGSGFILDTKETDSFHDSYVPDCSRRKHTLVSPAYDDLNQTCPAIMLVAGFDPYLDDNLAYGERLRASGVKVEMRIFESLIHGFAGMSELSRGARAAWEETIELINEAFG